MAQILRWQARSGSVLLGLALITAGVVEADAPAVAGGPGRAVHRVTSTLRLGLPLRGQAAPLPLRYPALIVGDSVLAAVFCTSRLDCWAVGESTINDVVRNQALHFNGKKWSPVPTPNPGGTAVNDSSQLDGVRCTARANCWAVGFYAKHGARLGEALHWNGRKWSLTAIPNPGGTLKGHTNELFDVACTSAVNCWADGDYGAEVSLKVVTLNLALHWNGKNWSQVDTPNPGGSGPGDLNTLDAVRCSSARNCWGVGSFGQEAAGSTKLDNEILHWNGKKWFVVTAPNPGKLVNGFEENVLNLLSCTSAKSCWAVGLDSGTNRLRNEALHWNGQKWEAVDAPQPAIGNNARNVLIGVSCTADTNCWAVGEFGNPSNNGAIMNEVLHWNGHKWFFVAVPEPAGTGTNSGNFLLADRCVSATNCWAVGDTRKFGKPDVNQILHFTGKRWFVVG